MPETVSELTGRELEKHVAKALGWVGVATRRVVRQTPSDPMMKYYRA